MADELLNAQLGELLPVINVTTGQSVATFSDVGANMKDAVITNLGPDGVVVSSNASAAAPSSSPVQNSIYIGPGAVVTVRKGLGVKKLSLTCPDSTAKVWISATNGA